MAVYDIRVKWIADGRPRTDGARKTRSWHKKIITSVVVSLYECIAIFHLEIMSRMRLTHLFHAHSIMLRNLSKIGIIIMDSSYRAQIGM